jgi:hypothetical protein
LALASSQQAHLTSERDAALPAAAGETEDPDQARASASASTNGQVVKGRATCSDGEPATGWIVTAFPDSWQQNPRRPEAAVDAEGYFTLHDVVADTYSISIEMPRGATSSSYCVMRVRLPPETGMLEVTVPEPSRGSVIAGQLTFTGGVPVTGTSVQVRAWSEEGEYADTHRFVWLPSATEPAPDEWCGPGPHEFRIAVPPGLFELRCEVPGFSSAVVPDVLAPSEGVELNLEYVGTPRNRTGEPSLRGVVVDARTQKPVTAFKARAIQVTRLVYYDKDDSWHDFHHSDAKFELDAALAGIYQVQVAADGLAWALSDEIDAGELRAGRILRVELPEGTSLSGLVVDQDGAPVSGATVAPLAMARGTIPRRARQFVSDSSGVQTVDGRFTLQNLATGLESIRVAHPDYCPAFVHDIELQEDSPGNTITVTLRRGGAIRGHVYDAEGNPERGITLALWDRGARREFKDGRVATAVTDDQGFYEVRRLPERLIYMQRDVYTRTWTEPGVCGQAIALTNGKTSTLDFGGGARTTGQLIINGTPLSAGTVLLSGRLAEDGAFRAFARTDTDGRFSLASAPCGTRSLYYAPPVDDPKASPDWARVSTFDSTGGDMDLGTISYATGTLSVIVAPEDDAGQPPEISIVGLRKYDPRRFTTEKVGRPVRDTAPSEPFVIEDVPPGTYELALYPPRPRRTSCALPGRRQDTLHHPVFLKRVEMPPGHERVSVIARVPSGTASVRGNLDTKLLQRFGWLRIVLWNAGKRTAVILPAHETEPTYKVQNLPAGRYVVTHPRGRADAVQIGRISLGEGETATLDLDETLIAGTPAANTQMGYLRAQVVTMEGIPVPGADVYLTGDTGRIDPWRSDDTAQRFQGQIGEYMLHVSYPGFRPTQRQVRLEPDEAKDTAIPEPRSVALVRLSRAD